MWFVYHKKQDSKVFAVFMFVSGWTMKCFPLLEMHSDNWIIQKVTSIQSVNNFNYVLSNWMLNQSHSQTFVSQIFCLHETIIFLNDLSGNFIDLVLSPGKFPKATYSKNIFLKIH